MSRTIKKNDDFNKRKRKIDRYDQRRKQFIEHQIKSFHLDQQKLNLY